MAAKKETPVDAKETVVKSKEQIAADEQLAANAAQIGETKAVANENVAEATALKNDADRVGHYTAVDDGRSDDGVLDTEMAVEGRHKSRENIVRTQGDDPALDKSGEPLKAPVASVATVAGAGEKMVSVRAIKTMSCTIGTTEVDIVAGRDYKMSDSIATILGNSGHIMRK